MLSKLRFFLYAALVFLALGAMLAWETDRNQVRRWLYPLKGQLVSLSTQCDSQAPAWLKEAAQTLATRFDSPTNQLVYWPADGKMQGCVNGWHDMPFLSPRVKDDTRFRMASLSKVVTFIGLLSAPSNTVALQQKETNPSSLAVSPELVTASLHTDKPRIKSQSSFNLTAKEQPLPEWLNHPVARVLAPTVPAEKYKDARIQEIRVRHFLNHSAGFDRLKVADAMVINDVTPWCPYRPEQIANETLQFSPGTRHSYANLGYCLAPIVYERFHKQDFFSHLQKTLRIADYGISFMDQQDSELLYNFMHQDFFGPDFMKHFDAQALRSSMGMTGNAKGLAQFVRDNWKTFIQFHAMHDSSINCNKKDQTEECFDGVLMHKIVNSHSIWIQRGYLFGMGALLLLDEHGNLLVWLGAGESQKAQENTSYLEKAFLNNNH